MAEKRMFTKKITDDDNFITLSSSAQALYFHLNQGADDDGFNNQVQMAMFKAHASIDDLKVLMAKNYIIRFESGVIVIKHWRMHNTLRKDRYTPTNFQEELQMLGIKNNGAYTLGCQTVAERLPQLSIDKNSKEEISINNNNHPADGYSSEFEKLWELYPRKEGKKSAFASYKRAKKKGVSFEDIESGILNYLEYIKIKKIGAKYIKQGSTWFNGECWNDEYDLTTPKEVIKPQETKSEYNSFMEQLAAMRE